MNKNIKYKINNKEIELLEPKLTYSVLKNKILSNGTLVESVGTLSDSDKKINELIEALGTPIEKEKEWSPEELKMFDKYYLVNDCGHIMSSSWENYDLERWRLKIGNCFEYSEKGKAKAKEYKQKLLELGKK